MPDILLIDTHPSVAAALSSDGSPAFEWGSFGLPPSAPPESVFRDPREYRVVVHDGLNAQLNWQRLADDDLLTRLSFAYERQYLFEEFLEDGRILIAFAGPPERVSFPPWGSHPFRNDERIQRFVFGGNRFTKNADGFNQNHWPKDMGSYFCLLPDDDHVEENPFGGPTAIGFSPRDSRYGNAFRRFAKEYAGAMRWCTAWPARDYYDRRFPLFQNASGSCVGFVDEEYGRISPKYLPDLTPGLFVLLPNIPDIATRTRAIVMLLRYVVPTLRVGWLRGWGKSAADHSGGEQPVDDPFAGRGPQQIAAEALPSGNLSAGPARFAQNGSLSVQPPAAELDVGPSASPGSSGELSETPRNTSSPTTHTGFPEFMRTITIRFIPGGQDVYIDVGGSPHLDPRDGVTLVFPLPSLKRQSQHEALRLLAKELHDHALGWLQPGDGEWCVDLDNMVSLLPNFARPAWLVGRVYVEPEYGFQQGSNLHGTQRFDAFVQFTILPDRMKRTLLVVEPLENAVGTQAAVPLTLSLTGRFLEDGSNEVVLGHRPVGFPDAQFRALLRLVVARIEHDDGLVSRAEIESAENASDDQGGLKIDLTHQGVNRLRNIFRMSVPKTGPGGLVEVPRTRGVRLTVAREQISWNTERLSRHPDQVVRELTRRLAKHEA